MFRKDINTLLLVLVAVAVVFSFTSCGKLSINKLKANHYFSRANHNFTEQHYYDAIENYERALEYSPELIEAYRFVGEAYKKLYKPGLDNETNNERAQRSLDALIKALEINPGNKQIIHSLGDMYDKMRNFEEAEKLFLMILEMEPTNMDNYYVVANFYKRYAGEDNDYGERAKSMYLRRIETDPVNPQGYAYLARYYDEKTPRPDFDKANEAHKIRLKLEPDNYLVWYTIGVNRYGKGFRLQNLLKRAEIIALAKESEEALKKSLELEPSHSFTYAYINLVYRQLYAKLYPEREKTYIERAESWLERYREVRKRELEREQLEKELESGEIH